MEQYFSQIEKYLNAQLSEKEKKAFEDELKRNTELFERYEFYKNLQDKRDDQAEIKVDFYKKIIPDFFVGNIKNKAAQKNKIIRSNVYISAIFIIAIVSGILFMYLPEKSRNNTINLAYNNKLDSFIFEINKKDKQIQFITKNKNNLIADTKTNIVISEQYLNELKVKDEELENIKNELAYTKQELYNNSNTAGIGEIENIRANLTDKIELNWECDKKVTIRVMNKDGNQLFASEEAVLNNYSFKILPNAFYYLHFIPEGRSLIVKLLEVGDNELTLWQQQ